MSTVALVVSSEERAEREQEGAQIVAQAQALVVHDHEGFAAAAAFRRDVIAPMKRKIADTFRPRIEQAHALHKGLLADERRFLTPWEEADRLINGRLVDYEKEAARVRREAEAAAARERERLARVAQEAAAAEQRRLQAEADERAQAAALAAEAAGDTELAERIISAPVVVSAPPPVPVFTPPVAAPPPPRAEGLSFRDSYRAEVTDLMALVRAIAGPCPTCRCPAPHVGTQAITLVLPNQVALNGLARALRGAMTTPGVRAVNDRTTAQRA